MIDKLPEAWEPMVIDEAQNFSCVGERGAKCEFICPECRKEVVDRWLRFLNAALEAGVAREAGAYDYAGGVHLEASTGLVGDVVSNVVFRPVLILNMGDVK